MNNILGMFQTFMQNPMSFMTGMNLSQGMMNNPNAIIQQMLNSGRINQAQYNQAQQMARQMQNNPAFKKYFR